ncbi:MAG: secretin N-terminal domain-containing protein [Veillonellales bacterium]
MHGRKLSVSLLLVLVMLCVAPPAAWAANPLVSLNVVDEDIGPVLHTLARLGGMNVVIDESVSGKVTLELNNIPFETAMDIVTKIKGLSYQKIGNVVVVGPAEKMNKGFGDIHIFKIQYANAADAASLISVALKDSQTASSQPSGQSAQGQQQGQNSQSQQGQNISTRIRVDDVTNSIVFIGSPGEVEQIRKILREIDVPCQQVSLEAEVLSLNKTATKDLGIDWTWTSTSTRSTDTSSDNSSSSSSNNSSNIQTSFGRTFNYQATVKALITHGDATVLSKPKITTINGKEAIINIGDEVPIASTTTSNNITTTSYTYRTAGIILKYTPRISADGDITAVVHTEVSAPVYVTDLKAYKFTNRSADTQVRLKDGETMVIGGLIGKDESDSVSKIPFLANLPLVGKLFQSHDKSKNETEVVIFLTARIVK